MIPPSVAWQFRKWPNNHRWVALTGIARHSDLQIITKLFGRMELTTNERALWGQPCGTILCVCLSWHMINFEFVSWKIEFERGYDYRLRIPGCTFRVYESSLVRYLTTALQKYLLG